MARRKRNSQNKQNQQQTGDKVINQLFGSLEEENDIESDIADLGTDGAAVEPEIPEPVKKKRFFFGFAIVVIIMAIIGVFSTVRAVVDITGRLLDNTSLRNEFAQFIFPVVVNDIAPFEKVEDIPNTSKVTCSIWNILITKDTTPYEEVRGGDLKIPEYDVMVSLKELFGSTATMEHQSVGIGEMRFAYDAENHCYSAENSIRYLTYAPQVVEMSESDDTYTLIVGYLPPALATVTGISGMEVVPEKYMEYTINRWDGKNTLMSVRFSDYVPETSES